MGISYNSLTLVPTPFVRLTKNVSSKNGDVIGYDYNISLIGNIVAATGKTHSPAGMQTIQTVQKSILAAFSESGHKLVIASPDASQKMEFYCEVQNIDFQEGIWYDTCPYTITLRANKLETVDADFDNIADVNESWAITYSQNHIWTLTHTISVTGQNSITSGGVQNDGLQSAIDHAESLLGVYDVNSDITFAGFNPVTDTTGNVNDVSNDNAYWSRSVEEQIDTSNLVYTVTETFVYHPLEGGLTGSYQDWSSAVTDTMGTYPSRKLISIRGTVYGLSRSVSDHATAMTNAKNDWATTIQPSLVTRATAIAGGYTVNPVPVQLQVSYNDNVGTIDYTVDFYATDGTLLPNAIEENIEIQDVGQRDIFAKIDVPGRIQGPVFQNMGTRTSARRVVNYSCRLSPNALTAGQELSSTSLLAAYNARPDTDFIFNAYKPEATGVRYYVDQNDVQWNPATLQYSRSMSWDIDLGAIDLGANPEPYDGYPAVDEFSDPDGTGS